MPPELGLDVDDSNPAYTVVAVTGEIDVYTAPLLREALVGLADSGPRCVVVDLTAVEFLDSTGLGVLVAALNRFRRHDGDVELICPQPRILRVFEITGLTRVFTIRPSLEDVGTSA